MKLANAIYVALTTESPFAGFLITSLIVQRDAGDGIFMIYKMIEQVTKLLNRQDVH